MNLRFLGTGTSFGIPVIGCSCPTCLSPDPRDQRTRHGALLEQDGRRILIDAPPELRLQLLRAKVADIDAVWFTHYHADHTHGIDDLRVFSMRAKGPLAVYAPQTSLDVLATKFNYIFDHLMKPVEGTTKPEGDLHILEAYQATDIAGLRLTPLPVPHGPVEVYGFRAGDLGYITDAKRLPDRTRRELHGVKVLVLNALWFGNPHPTHFSVEEAVEVALDIGAERTYLTHLSHRATHCELEDRLPAGILPAYDGLTIDL